MRPVNMDKVRSELAKKSHREVADADLASYLMYPEVFTAFEKFRRQFDDVSVLPTKAFFYPLQPFVEVPVELEPGKTMLIKFITSGDADPDGMRTIFFELNGQPREVKIHDRSLSGKSRTSLPKADRDNPRHVGAPMPGKISTLAVSLGQSIAKGEKLLSIEAMKMETSVYCPVDGKIAKIVTPPGTIVSSGDLLIELE